MKKILVLLLCVVLVLSVFTGCEKDKKPQLTDKQNQTLALMVQNRDQWATTSESITSYPVNRVHVYDNGEGLVILTVAFMDHRANGDKIFVGVRGFAVYEGEFVSVGTTHYNDWIVDCVTVDMEKMSDEELYNALEQSYINCLNKRK